MVPSLKSKKNEGNLGKINVGVTITRERLCFEVMRISNSYLAGAKKKKKSIFIIIYLFRLNAYFCV